MLRHAWPEQRPRSRAPATPELQLWRLDCGDFMMKRFGAWFSDTFQYPPGARPLVGSCYLIRHGSDYMLWDTGMSDELNGKPIDNSRADHVARSARCSTS